MSKLLKALCLLFVMFTQSLGAERVKHQPDPNPPYSVVRPCLFYLNHPESVRHSGDLANKSIPNHTRVRIFFHYINKTGLEQVFTLKSDNGFEDLRCSNCINYDPGVAGSTAAVQFLSASSKRGKINLTAVLKPCQTTSGIVEGTTDSVTRFICSMGRGDSIKGASIQTFSNIEESLQYLVRDRDTECFLGATHLGHVDGEFGTTFHIKFINDSDHTRKLKVYVSPRGGDMIVPYALDAMVHITPRIHAYEFKGIGVFTLSPHKAITLTTLNAGGWNFPLVVGAKPIK